MSELSLDLNNPQLSAEDWRFIENRFEWFFTPQTSDTASTVPQWADNGYRYSLYLGYTADDLAVHGVIRWDTDVAKGDVFQFIPQTKQILVTKDFHPDFPDYEYEKCAPGVAEIAEVEEILGMMKAQYADFAVWEQEIAPPEQPKQHTVTATPLEQYLGSVVGFWDGWRQNVRKLWGL